MDINEKKVIEALKSADKPLKTSEAANRTNLSPKDVSKIISKLKKDGLIESPKRCYYSAK